MLNAEVRRLKDLEPRPPLPKSQTNLLDKLNKRLVARHSPWKHKPVLKLEMVDEPAEVEDDGDLLFAVLKEHNIQLGASVCPGPDWIDEQHGDRETRGHGSVVGFRMSSGKKHGDSPCGAQTCNVEWHSDGQQNVYSCGRNGVYHLLASIGESTSTPANPADFKQEFLGTTIPAVPSPITPNARPLPCMYMLGCVTRGDCPFHHGQEVPSQCWCMDTVNCLCAHPNRHPNLSKTSFVTSPVKKSRLKCGKRMQKVLKNDYNAVRNHGQQIMIAKYNGKNLGVEGARELTILLDEAGSQVKEFHLADNDLEEDGLAEFKELFLNHQCMTLLDLSHNNLGPDGTTLLASIIERNPRLPLATLKLHSNQMTVEGGPIIAKLLEFNKTITDIDLRFNQLFAEGASAIAKVLARNKTIRKLNLSNNTIADDGMVALAEALSTNDCMENCQVVQNSFGLRGTLAIANMIRVNQGLEVFNMHMNRTEEDGEASLRKNLHTQDQLHHLLWGLISEEPQDLRIAVGFPNH